jgi:hypothetical protein
MAIRPQKLSMKCAADCSIARKAPEKAGGKPAVEGNSSQETATGVTEIAQSSFLVCAQ